ncbi:hypothetical protein H0H92_004257 [Tricholoma furcatifolium]|nr:hypothetical protein H0H92_004257 [Tricholoma furcatifolium]
MIKTRYGETLPQAPNMLQITPFETSSRHLRHISDYASYKKLYSTLPAVVLSALKVRVKAGEPRAIREIWSKRDKTFLAIDFEWSERNENTCLEWGYAAIKCGHLDTLGHWPPDPSKNYRHGHFIIGEYVDKVVNKHFPTYPWHYAFGDSQVISKSKLPEIIQAVVSSLASPDSETTPNTLVLVAHGLSGDLHRLEEMKIKFPHNMLMIDTATFERVLHSTGMRGMMTDPRTNAPRVPGATLSLENLLRSFTTNPLPHSPKGEVSPSPGTGTPTSLIVLPNVMMHNAGNDAFLALFALQMLLDPAGTKVPTLKKGRGGMNGFNSMNGAMIPSMPSMPMLAVPVPVMPGARPLSMMGSSPVMPMVPGPIPLPSPVPAVMPGVNPVVSGSYDLAAEFGAMKVGQAGEKEKDVWMTGTGSRRRLPGKDIHYAFVRPTIHHHVRMRNLEASQGKDN